MNQVVHVETDRSFTAEEFAELMAAVHWAEPDEFPPGNVETALDAYHFIGHARDETGLLVGYLCAFSDGAFATFVGDLVVHPSARGAGVGGALLDAVEGAFAGVPVFVLGFRDARGFFEAQGYTSPPRPLDVLTKLTTWPEGEEITPQAAEG